MNLTEDDLRRMGLRLEGSRAVRLKGVMPSEPDGCGTYSAEGGVTHPPKSTSKVEFFVAGIPRPQGSLNALAPGVVASANPELKPWRFMIALLCPRQRFFARGEAVSLSLWFSLPRPQSLPKKVQHSTKKPDLDKLIRAVCDALTGVLWNDDAQVVEVIARKRYDSHVGVRILAEALQEGADIRET